MGESERAAVVGDQAERIAEVQLKPPLAPKKVTECEVAAAALSRATKLESETVRHDLWREKLRALLEDFSLLCHDVCASRLTRKSSATAGGSESGFYWRYFHNLVRGVGAASGSLHRPVRMRRKYPW